MSWNYEEQLKSYIAQAQRDSGVGSDYLFEVCTEQIFVKKKTLSPNTIYVVIKYLSSTNTLNAVTQPIQIIISCEQDQIQISQIVFSKLVEAHNFEAILSDGTYIKQDYREPVVLSNFNEIAYGYRTIMYISATLFIMENVMDIENFTITTNHPSIVDLTAEEITQKNGVFEDFELPEDNPTPVYAIDTSELSAALTDVSNEVCGMEIINDDHPENKYIVVNDIHCNKVVFVGSYEVSLLDQNDDEIERLNLNNFEYLYMQFLTYDYNDTMTAGAIDGGVFYQVFPDIVTKKKGIGTVIESVKPINLNLAYSMTPNTQQIPPALISTSVKSLATFSMSFTVPMISTYQFITDISNIAAGIQTGNTDFIVSFSIGSVEFTNLPMKLVSAQVTTAINEVPGLQIGMMR